MQSLYTSTHSYLGIPMPAPIVHLPLNWEGMKHCPGLRVETQQGTGVATEPGNLPS